jgi:urease accessory protein
VLSPQLIDAGLDGRLDVSLVDNGRGGSSVERLRSSGALAARPTPWGIYLVATAAHPVGDDRTHLDLALGTRAEAEVRSTGATLSRRGMPGTSRSAHLTTATVGEAATLQWLVEPGIAAVGSCHASRARIELASGARLAWRDEVVLGRHGEEPPGSWTTALEVTRAGRPLLASEVGLGPAAPAWRLASVLDGARAWSELLLVDPARDVRSWPALVVRCDGARAMSSPLTGPAVLLTAWGGELGTCRRALGALLERIAPPTWLKSDVIMRHSLA